MPSSTTVPQEQQFNQARTAFAMLLAGWCGLLSLFFISMPAVQASRSTSLSDRTVGAMESLMYLVPMIVFAMYFSLSAVRIRYKWAVARYAALAQLLATVSFAIWLVFELLI
ncbi:MAG: hypothetical protein MUC83_17305 [Pirellula sp.]|jgi:hypothetical protein|nr:hypothetical protein [Pirellula sp.]